MKMKNIIIAALVGAVLLLGVKTAMPQDHPKEEIMVKGQVVDAQGHVTGSRDMPLSEALTQLQRNIIETQFLIAKTSKDTDDKIDAAVSKLH